MARFARYAISGEHEADHDVLHRDYCLHSEWKAALKDVYTGGTTLWKESGKNLNRSLKSAKWPKGKPRRSLFPSEEVGLGLETVGKVRTE